MKSTISKLSLMLNEGGDKSKIEFAEEVLVDSIEETIKEDDFYSLPMNEITKIVEKSHLNDASMLKSLVSKLSEIKGRDSIIILNSIESSELTFEECINIISHAKYCPIFNRIGKLYEDESKLPEVDFEAEIELLKKENEKLKKLFVPITEKPIDFENDILKAIKEGKLTSVQYLFEKCNKKKELNEGKIQKIIICAVIYKQFGIIKYLHEVQHLEVNGTDIYYAVLVNAAMFCNFEMVKYICENYPINIELADKTNEITPIQAASLSSYWIINQCPYDDIKEMFGDDIKTIDFENGPPKIIEYLREKYHFDIEEKDSGEHSLLHYASAGGNLSTVKFLVEKYHVNVESIDNEGKTPL